VAFFPSVPPALRAHLCSASAVAFSGGRRPARVSLVAAGLVLSCLPASVPVSVGCSPGVDRAVRVARPSASVFFARSFGSGPFSFVQRSVAVVRSVSSVGLFVCFPSCACPPSVVPSASVSRCFCGGGSGSWASLAFAVGSGVPCFFFLPPGVPAPAWLFAVPLGGGWFLCLR
jgi:hypothetical protein